MVEIVLFLNKSNPLCNLVKSNSPKHLSIQPIVGYILVLT